MSAEQLPLDLAWRAAHGREDFLVADPNKEAVAWIDRWPDWPGNILLLVGPEGCGKTHLSHVWKRRVNAEIMRCDELASLDLDEIVKRAEQALVLEDLGTDLPEDKLFHLYNLVREKKSSLLMTSRMDVREWNISLPDLKSRMGAIQIARIQEPDDILFASILLKLFSDRHLQIGPEVIQYLMTRLERSFGQARHMVSSIDGLSLSQKRRITIPLIRDLLEKEGHI
ncbi:MAG: DNA replication protein [Sneathiella sp.]